MPKISALPALSTEISPDFEIPFHNTTSGSTEKITLGDLTGYPDFGWTGAVETWVYSSWSATTRIGVITVPSDATTKYNVGWRIRITQSTGGTKYGIIVAVSATTLTVFFPSGTTLNNETITDPLYSSVKVPFGFNADPLQWELSTTLNTTRSMAVSASWVAANAADVLTIGIGSWSIILHTSMLCTSASSSARYMYGTLSSTTNSETNPEFTQMIANDREEALDAAQSSTFTVNYPLLLAAQTTMRLLGRVSNVTSVTAQEFNHSTAAGFIKAQCAYL